MAEANWKVSGRHASRLGRRCRRAAIRPVPAGLVVGVQDPGDGLAVPELLVVPHGEERGHLRVPVGPGHQDVAQVADGVVLDVVHVAQAAQRVGSRGRSRKASKSMSPTSSLAESDW